MMMKRVLIASAVSAALLATAACGPTIVLAPTGAYAVGKDSRTTLNRDWSDATAISGLTKVRMLTIDGPLLNRLYLSEGLVPGDYLAPPVRKAEATTPTYAAAMSVTEQVEFVANSVEAFGYQRVATSNVRPVTINDQRGVRFDIDTVSPDGLNYKGRGQVVKANDKLYVAIYIAAEEHYFQTSLASAEAAMDAVTF